MSDESATTRLKRIWAGIKSQMKTRDPETGELYWGGIQDLKDDFAGIPMSQRKRKSHPGIVDETVSLPALMALVPGGEKYVPDWAIQASDRADQMHQAARAEEGLSAPKGFAENAEEGLGVMLGQVPLPLTKLRQLAAVRNLPSATKAPLIKKILGSAPEWFSPSVDPSAANYLAGAGFGGALGAYSDYRDDQAAEQESTDRADRMLASRVVRGDTPIPGMPTTFQPSDNLAEGGKVGALAQALRGLRINPNAKIGSNPLIANPVGRLRDTIVTSLPPEEASRADDWIQSRRNRPE